MGFVRNSSRIDYCTWVKVIRPGKVSICVPSLFTHGPLEEGYREMEGGDQVREAACYSIVPGVLTALTSVAGPACWVQAAAGPPATAGVPPVGQNRRHHFHVRPSTTTTTTPPPHHHHHRPPPACPLFLLLLQ